MKITIYQTVKQAYIEMAYLCPMVHLGLSKITDKEINFIPYVNNKPFTDFAFTISSAPLSKEYIAFCVLQAAKDLRNKVLPPFNHDFKAVYSGNEARFYLNGKRISYALGKQIQNTTYAPERKTTIFENKKIVTLVLKSTS